MAAAAATFSGALEESQRDVPDNEFTRDGARREWSYLPQPARDGLAIGSLTDNPQGGGNRVHSLWRDPANDFGDNILAAHYRAEHSSGGSGGLTPPDEKG
jgi:hypothetical protein